MIGLTGGIASGKSAAARRFQELGAILIDADQISRDVVAKGTPALKDIASSFGPEVLTPEGTLNRPVLGAIVFSDEEKREQLNAIVHPRVREESARLISAAAAGSVIVQDIPLLVETGQAKSFDIVVVVEAPIEERIRRMTEGRGMSREDALARISAQASDSERAKIADVILDNSGSLEDLKDSVDRFWDEHVANESPAGVQRSEDK